MIKIASCILIFLGCTLMGFSKAFTYRQRREELENTVELVRVLNLEISYRKDSLKKTFERISKLKKSWFADMLGSCGKYLNDGKSIEKSWELSLAENADTCPLLQSDVEILKDISMGIGRSDTEGQKKIFEPAMERLLSNVKDARDDEQRMGKMYKGLGIAGGIAVSIIII